MSMTNTLNIRRDIRRGDVCWVEIEVKKGSKKQSGVRPVLVIANQKAIDNSPVIQCIPLTTKLKRLDLPTHVVLTSGNLREVTMALTEQLELIDKNELGEKQGSINAYDMRKINHSIVIQLALDDMEMKYAPKYEKKLQFAM